MAPAQITPMMDSVVATDIRLLGVKKFLETIVAIMMMPIRTTQIVLFLKSFFALLKIIPPLNTCCVFHNGLLRELVPVQDTCNVTFMHNNDTIGHSHNLRHFR